MDAPRAWSTRPVGLAETLATDGLSRGSRRASPPLRGGVPLPRASEDHRASPLILTPRTPPAPQSANHGGPRGRQGRQATPAPTADARHPVRKPSARPRLDGALSERAIVRAWGQHHQRACQRSYQCRGIACKRSLESAVRESAAAARDHGELSPEGQAAMIELRAIVDELARRAR